jgi:hypothetical protein
VALGIRTRHDVVQAAQERLFGGEADADDVTTRVIRGEYPFGLVTSAMRKEIRKGDSAAAMF